MIFTKYSIDNLSCIAIKTTYSSYMIEYPGVLYGEMFRHSSTPQRTKIMVPIVPYSNNIIVGTTESLGILSLKPDSNGNFQKIFLTKPIFEHLLLLHKELRELYLSYDEPSYDENIYTTAFVDEFDISRFKEQVTLISFNEIFIAECLISFKCIASGTYLGWFNLLLQYGCSSYTLVINSISSDSLKRLLTYHHEHVILQDRLNCETLTIDRPLISTCLKLATLRGGATFIVLDFFKDYYNLAAELADIYNISDLLQDVCIVHANWHEFTALVNNRNEWQGNGQIREVEAFPINAFQRVKNYKNIFDVKERPQVICCSIYVYTGIKDLIVDGSFIFLNSHRLDIPVNLKGFSIVNTHSEITGSRIQGVFQYRDIVNTPKCSLENRVEYILVQQPSTTCVTLCNIEKIPRITYANGFVVNFFGSISRLTNGFIFNYSTEWLYNMLRGGHYYISGGKVVLLVGSIKMTLELGTLDSVAINQYHLHLGQFSKS